MKQSVHSRPRLHLGANVIVLFAKPQRELRASGGGFPLLSDGPAACSVSHADTAPLGSALDQTGRTI